MFGGNTNTLWLPYHLTLKHMCENGVFWASLEINFGLDKCICTFIRTLSTPRISNWKYSPAKTGKHKPALIHPIYFNLKTVWMSIKLANCIRNLLYSFSIIVRPILAIKWLKFWEKCPNTNWLIVVYFSFQWRYLNNVMSHTICKQQKWWHLHTKQRWEGSDPVFSWHL